MNPRLPALALTTLLAALTSACPAAAARPEARPTAPTDTAYAGVFAAARAQIQDGKPALAAKQLLPVVAALDTRSEPAEPLLQAWCEALGKSALPVDSAAVSRARRAVELSAALHGERSLASSTSQLNLGRLLLRAHQTRAARAAVDSAVALRRVVPGADGLDLATALVLAGKAARECDDLDSSERCVNEVFEIRSRLLPAGHLDIATALNNRSITRRIRGDLEGAYRDSRAAAGIISKKLPVSHPNHINAYNSLGITALFAGDPVGGIAAFQEAIAGLEQATPVDSGGLAEQYAQLGLAYRDLGDRSRSYECEAKSQAIVRSLALPDSFQTRNVLINHAECLRSFGDLAAARVELEAALRLERARPAASTEGLEAIEQNLGELLRNGGQPDSAITHLTRVVAMRTKRLGPDAVASVLLERAQAWRAIGQRDSARVDLGHVITMSERQVGRSALLPAAAHTLEAELVADAGDGAAAFDEALASESTARAKSQQILRYISERQALAFARSRPQALDLVLSLAAQRGAAPERAPRAWDCLVRSRGLVLDEFAARQAALRERADSTTSELQRRHFAVRQRIANLVLQQNQAAPDPASANALASATAEADALEQALAQAAAPADARGAEPGLAEVRTALPPSSALVAYVRWNDASGFELRGNAREQRFKYGAWIATAGKAQPAFVDLGSGEAIDALVDDWRRVLETGPAGAERAAGERLRRAVWEPVRARAPDPRIVYLVPDGRLNGVSWYALPWGSRRLLDEDLELRLLSSEKDLLERAPVHEDGRPILVLGGADFDAAPGGTPALLAGSTLPASATSSLRSATGECDAFLARRFGKLPFSAREAADVSALARRRFGGTRVRTLVGSAAGEANFLSAAPGAAWIHGATHGFFLDQACRDRTGLGAPEFDPLLYSGIALAGANCRTGATGHGADGILTADEFAGLDLSRVEGMVITGCNTGLGEYVTGEGVFGLRRALERAGVRSLALALWPLDDQASERWSIAFYEGLWNRGLPPALANREAMRTVRTELRAAGQDDAPRRWGGMVVSGP